MKHLFPMMLGCACGLAWIAICSLLLTACASAPPLTPLPEPKVTVFLLIGDCTAPGFAMAVDDHGNVAIIGGDAKPTPAQQALIARAHEEAPPDGRYNIRIGECSDN